MDFKLIDRIIALGNLMGHAKLGFIEADNELRVSSWNQGAAQIFGYSEDDTMGRFLYELIPIARRELNNCKQTQFITCSQVNNKGKEIQCDLYYTPIRNTNGEKIGIAVLTNDISSRLKDKENLKKQEQHLKDIFGFAPVGICHVNSLGKVISANPEFAWMLGYESAETVTDQITNFASQVFFDKEKATEFMFGVNEADEVIRFRCRLSRKDYTSVWTLCYAKTTRDSSGRKNGFNGFFIDITETVRAEQDLKKANEKLQMLSVIDGLTQIPNRRRFDEYLNSEWKRHYRDKLSLAVIICDIDFFKLYNDHYGHQGGDHCLQKVAQAIYGCAERPGDLAARYGGEEFVLILPVTDAMGALAVADKIRTSVANLNIPHEKSKVAGHVSLSLGVAAVVPDSTKDPLALVKEADEGLYLAKANGRNQAFCKGYSV